MEFLNNSANSNSTPCSGNTTLVYENTTMPEEQLEFGVSVAVMSTLTIMCIGIAWTLNIIILRALGTVEENRLKVKFLLRMAIVGDMMLSFSLGIRLLLQLIKYNEDNKELASLCINMAPDFYSLFATYFQIFASMAVGIDRFASVVKPLVYHTKKYTRLVKTAIVGAVFALSFGLPFPLILVLRLEPGDLIVAICYKAFDQLRYAGEVLPVMIIVSVITTLVLYCFIFVVVILHRRKSRNTLGERTESQQATKSEMPLALTFFLINITYVLTYLPGALYHSILSWRLKSQLYLDFYIGQLTIVIYLGNTVVDPLIYMFKIRSIRNQILKMFCQVKLSSKTITKRAMDTDPSAEGKHLPTVSSLAAVSTVDPKLNTFNRCWF